MAEVAILPLALALLALLLRFERTQQRVALIPTKTALSALFVVTGALQATNLPGYRGLILTGLIFSLVGDVLLALPQRRAFLLGLVAFLIGHIWYAVAFIQQVTLAWWVVVGWVALAAFALGVFRWLRPHVGSMLVPVVAYILVISVMVGSVLAMSANPDLGLSGRLLALSGATLFFVSDLFVARDRFIDRSIRNRYAGLPLYYVGQFMIALSIGAIAG